MKMGGQLMEDEIVWQLDKDVVQHVGVWGQTWGPAIETSSSADFLDRVKGEYNTTAYSRHYLGYTAMDQLVRAVRRAKSTDPGQFRDALNGHEYTDNGLLDGKQYWRGCNQLNITPTYAVKALPAEEMQDDPHRVWFEQTDTFAGDEVARTCEETGCSL